MKLTQVESSRLYRERSRCGKNSRSCDSASIFTGHRQHDYEGNSSKESQHTVATNNEGLNTLMGRVLLAEAASSACMRFSGSPELETNVVAWTPRSASSSGGMVANNDVGPNPGTHRWYSGCRCGGAAFSCIVEKSAQSNSGGVMTM